MARLGTLLGVCTLAGSNEKALLCGLEEGSASTMKSPELCKIISMHEKRRNNC